MMQLKLKKLVLGCSLALLSCAVSAKSGGKFQGLDFSSSYQGFNIDFNVADNGKRFSGSLQSNPIFYKFSVPGRSAQVIEYKTNGMTLSATGNVENDFKVPELNITVDELETDIKIDTISLGYKKVNSVFQSKINDSNNLDISLQSTMQGAYFINYTNIGPLEFKLSANELDAAQIMAKATAISTLAKGNKKLTAKQQALVVKYLLQMLTDDNNFNLFLKLGLKEQFAQLSVKLNFIELAMLIDSIEDKVEPVMLMQSIKVAGDVKVDMDFVNKALPDYLEPNQLKQLKQMIDMWVKQGMVEVKNNAYVTHFEVKEGQLQVNGKMMAR